MGSEFDRLSRMMKIKTDQDIANRRNIDFARRKEQLEEMRRNKRRMKQEKKTG